MKISDSGLFKRKSGTREFRKVYFIAFEGLTELEYFTGIKNNKQRLGISNSIDVQLIERFEQNWVNPILSTFSNVCMSIVS